jgi:hypothetical protein
MARVTYVKSAKGRKDGRDRRCVKCGADIKPGDSYKWLANRIGRMSQRKDFCATCPVRQSDRTTSPHLQTIYLAQESAQDALDQGGGTMGLADVAETVRGYAEGVREAAESYGESADNMEDGFGHETEMSASIREKAEACEATADEIDTMADEIESLDDPDAEEEEFSDDYEGETDEDDKPVDADEWAEHVENKREERREAAISAAQDALNEEPQF